MPRKHPRKELGDLIADARARGWAVDDGGRYWKIKCPNECKCYKTVKCTPSGAYYVNHARQFLEKSTCWGKP